ncbi:MAG: GH25 family lysozyme [Acidobacteriota bacterium]|jgi:GH25 family lysozyme M1 (1,4-beta-N-acetylmuramidase)
MADDTPDTNDPGPPYLFVDLYPLDLGPKPPWSVVAATPGFCGAIIKASEGTQYDDRGWFAANWPAVRDAGGDRYGESWFRGAYLFLKFAQSGADQADAYLKAIDDAGGWGDGDILPIVDVELGSETNSNRKASAQQIIDCTTECAERLRQQTSRRVILYGRGAMRDLSINSRMGCDAVWNPSYTAQMVRHGLEAWELEDIVLWQYCGDGTAAIDKLPHEVKGFGKVDISVFVKGAQVPTLRLLRDNLLA